MLEILKDLPEDVQAKLKEEIEANYVSKTEFENVKSKSQQLLDETKKAKEVKSEAERIAEQARLDALAKNNDVESLRQSYESKLREKEDLVNSFLNEKRTMKLETVTSEFMNSTKVIDDPFIKEAMSREIMKRLDVRDGEVVVLDPKGNLTANTIDDLKKEFVANDKYAKHFIGSKASGGNTARSDKGSSTKTVKSLSDISFNDKEARLAAIRARLST